MYQDENAFFFKVGYELRENIFVKYKVTNIERAKDDILVAVKPIGYRLGEPEKVFPRNSYIKELVYMNL